MQSLPEILQQVRQYDCGYVTVTGGEPLAQPNCIPLLSMLCDEGVEVSLETSGAMAIDDVDERVSIVLDLKTPGSAELEKNRMENIGLLKAKDQVKFVLCNRQDYEWAKAKLLELNLGARVSDVLFSPSHEELPPAQLADWIVEDRLAVRMQVQLHKLLWGAEPGR